MEIKNYRVHHRAPDAFDIDADEKLYHQIVEDMMQHAGNFIPRSVWQKLYDDRDINTIEEGAARYQEVQYTDEQVRENAYDILKRYYNMRIMMAAWVGMNGEKNQISEEQLEPYRNYLSSFEKSAKFFDAMQKNLSDSFLADFRTVEEITLLSPLLAKEKELHVLEIGGGYGRLAEGLLNVYENQPIHYILSDSVPVSLMYCYLYMKKAFPEKKVGIYYEDPKASPSLFDIYIVPTWHLEAICNLNHISFNLFLNIQSMQEMSQWHVDYYLNLFNKLGTEQALIFLNNNKKYIFRGEWNYPKNWRLLFRQNSPWSWSDDCPTEMFIKDQGEFSSCNTLVNFAYESSRELSVQLNELHGEMSACQTRLSEKEADVESKAQEIEHQKKMIANMSENLQSKGDSISTLNREIQGKENRISSLNRAMRDKENTISSLNQAMQDKENTIFSLSQAMQDKENTISSLNQAMQDKENVISSLNNEIQRIYHTVSWKITKPLRDIKNILHKQ